MSELAKSFEEMIALGQQIARENELRRKWAAELAQLVFAQFDDAQMRALWDQYDGCNSPSGFCGEDIHAELNRRGDGGYCAV
jgi:hypothetical protein